MEPIGIVVTSIVVKMILAVIAFVLGLFALRRLDNIVGVNFKEWIADADSTNKAFYFGARFVGICLLVGFIIS